MFGACVVLVAYVASIVFVRASRGLVPIVGCEYTIEASRAPHCPYRHLSHDEGRLVDYWHKIEQIRPNQHWQLIDSDSDGGSFYLKTWLGTYMSYSPNCNDQVVELTSAPGSYQRFKLIVVKDSENEYYIQAVGRHNCLTQFLGFPDGCVDYLRDRVELWSSAAQNQRFLFHPSINSNRKEGCPMPMPGSGIPVPSLEQRLEASQNEVRALSAQVAEMVLNAQTLSSHYEGVLEATLKEYGAENARLHAEAEALAQALADKVQCP